ncbi:type VI secretion system baseplate subunit TssF [bacterium]|nr:type VI secretion system baseplate subunit TssF [candidate division CSSED10-310 bacterium]
MERRRNIEDYYREEINYLKERGREFAKAYPNLMPFFLETGRLDPHVDRILEGSAFLCAKLHMALDISQNHLASELLKLFWPQILSPVPSTSMVELKLRPTTTSPQKLEKGTVLETEWIESKRSGSKQIKYRAQASAVVNPMELVNVSTSYDFGAWSLQLLFKTSGGAMCKDLNFDQPLPIQIYDPDEYAMFSAYEDLKYRTDQNSSVCEILVKQGNDWNQVCKAVFYIPFPLSKSPVFPYPRNVFPGFRILQEFFLIPSYFMMIEIDGLNKLNDFDASEFKIIIPFKRKEKPNFDWQTSNLKLHCIPVVNVFKDKCRSISTNLESRRFRLLLDEMNPSGDSATIHSIENVFLKAPGQKWESEIEPFNLFHTSRNLPDGDLLKPSYSLEYELDKQENGTELRHVYLVLRNATPLYRSKYYTLHAEALWSDTDINEFLLEMRINRGTPETMTCHNIFPPTPYITPIDPSHLRWFLVEIMAMNYQSVDTSEGLKKLLKLLNPKPTPGNSVYEESIEKVIVTTKRFYDKRLPINGQEFIFHIRDNVFRGCRGKMLAFFDIVHAYLTEYISINSKVSVKTVLLDSEKNELNLWKPYSGSRKLV